MCRYDGYWRSMPMLSTLLLLLTAYNFVFLLFLLLLRIVCIFKTNSKFVGCFFLFSLHFLRFLFCFFSKLLRWNKIHLFPKHFHMAIAHIVLIRKPIIFNAVYGCCYCFLSIPSSEQKRSEKQQRKKVIFVRWRTKTERCAHLCVDMDCSHTKTTTAIAAAAAAIAKPNICTHINVYRHV